MPLLTLFLLVLNKHVYDTRDQNGLFADFSANKHICYPKYTDIRSGHMKIIKTYVWLFVITQTDRYMHTLSIFFSLTFSLSLSLSLSLTHIHARASTRTRLAHTKPRSSEEIIQKALAWSETWKKKQRGRHVKLNSLFSRYCSFIFCPWLHECMKAKAEADSNYDFHNTKKDFPSSFLSFPFQKGNKRFINKVDSRHARGTVQALCQSQSITASLYFLK